MDPRDGVRGPFFAFEKTYIAESVDDIREKIIVV